VASLLSPYTLMRAEPLAGGNLTHCFASMDLGLQGYPGVVPHPVALASAVLYYYEYRKRITHSMWGVTFQHPIKYSTISELLRMAMLALVGINISVAYNWATDPSKDSKTQEAIFGVMRRQSWVDSATYQQTLAAVRMVLSHWTAAIGFMARWAETAEPGTDAAFRQMWRKLAPSVLGMGRDKVQVCHFVPERFADVVLAGMLPLAIDVRRLTIDLKLMASLEAPASRDMSGYRCVGFGRHFLAPLQAMARKDYNSGVTDEDLVKTPHHVIFRFAQSGAINATDFARISALVNERVRVRNEEIEAARAAGASWNALVSAANSLQSEVETIEVQSDADSGDIEEVTTVVSPPAPWAVVDLSAHMLANGGAFSFVSQ